MDVFLTCLNEMHIDSLGPYLVQCLVSYINEMVAYSFCLFVQEENF
jgi:hypothetical protein